MFWLKQCTLMQITDKVWSIVRINWKSSVSVMLVIRWVHFWVIGKEAFKAKHWTTDVSQLRNLSLSFCLCNYPIYLKWCMFLNTEIVFFIYIYPSILPLQASKTKEIVELMMLTSQSSYNKSHQKPPELLL